MTIYDLLCNSKENCVASKTFCPSDILKNTVKSFNSGGGFYQKIADQLAGNTTRLEKALNRIGQKADVKGDVASYINAFDFLQIVVQFWDSDEEFLLY